MFWPIYGMPVKMSTAVGNKAISGEHVGSPLQPGFVVQMATANQDY